MKSESANSDLVEQVALNNTTATKHYKEKSVDDFMLTTRLIDPVAQFFSGLEMRNVLFG